MRSKSLATALAAATVAVVALAGAALAQRGQPESSGAECVPVSAWARPASGAANRIDTREILQQAARKSVVLLGEAHDSYEHHRWQLHTIAALHALRPDMVLALEMFPRRVQPALDRWVRGELTEAEFLAAADWRNVWRFDPSLYLPIFHFARMNRIPMLAVNVESALIREVSAKGLDGVTEAMREGVTRPAPPVDTYVDFLLASYAEHEQPGGKNGKTDRSDGRFQRFVESQQVWDRAMAQGIATAASGSPSRLVVGIMGSGHVVNGWGVPHQLKDLGVADVMTLLPWDRGRDCGAVTAGMADALFGVSAPAVAERPRQRLGVFLEAADGAVRVRRVEKDSLAEATGIRDGDVISEIAGVYPKAVSDVVEVVQRHAPGTWLPLTVRRQDETIQLVAKFPPLAKQ